jgi:hypothetical protein
MSAAQPFRAGLMFGGAPVALLRNWAGIRISGLGGIKERGGVMERAVQGPTRPPGGGVLRVMVAGGVAR